MSDLTRGARLYKVSPGPGWPLWLICILGLAALGLINLAVQVLHDFAATNAEFARDPVGGDLRLIWAAVHLIYQGHAEQISDGVAIAQATGQMQKTQPNFYPPSFLMLVWPVGGLDFPVLARMHWVLSTSLFFWASVLAATRERSGLRLSQVLVFTVLSAGSWFSSLFGQVSIYIAVMWMLAYRYYEHPMVSGLLVGLASVKPHLGVLVPGLWAYQRQWRAFAAAAAITLLLLVLPALLWGWQIYMTYLQAVPHLWQRVSLFAVGDQNSPMSLVAALHRLQAPPLVSVLVYLAYVALMLGLTARLCGRVTDRATQFAFLPLAGLFILPQWYPYDLVLIHLPLLVMLKSLIQPAAGWAARLVWGLFVILLPLAIDLNVLCGLSPLLVLAPLLLWLAPTIVLSEHESISLSEKELKAI